ncbi:ABC transporter transmembrane domain-containing protein [Peptoniphilus sp.]|uniref:ABC transporter transmembrane domain-containing protein n=1 Tax=Peptoniphilus sp. TaxID=1971214 RepID=UPI003992491A
MKSFFKISKKYIKKNKIKLIIFLILSTLSGILSLVLPYYSGKFIDKLINKPSVDFITKYSLFFCAFVISNIIVGYFVNRIYINIQTIMSYNLNKDVLRHLNKVDILEIQSYDSTYLTQRINNDCNSIMIFSISILQDFVINLIKLIIPIIIIWSINHIFTIITIVGSFLYLLIYILFKKILYKLNYEFIEDKSMYFNELCKQIKHIRFIKIHSIEDKFMNNLNFKFIKMFNTAMKLQKVSYLFSSLDTIIVSIVQILVFIIGGISVVNKDMTVGELTIITAYFSFILNSGTYFFMLSKNIQENKPCVNRINDLMNIPTNINGKKKLKNIDCVEIKELYFCYGNRKNIIINNFNYTFRKNNLYLIQGSNGTGKSTIVNLIIGLYSKEFKGKILFNGIDYKLLDMNYMRREIISVCEQEPQLIEDTIYNNVSLYNNISLEHLGILINKLGLNTVSILENLENSLIINEQNRNISGGEKQAIALIRALNKKCDLLILDEPTSAIDVKKIDDIKNYIKEIKKDKIIIVISHEDYWKTLADKIITIEDYFN